MEKKETVNLESRIFLSLLFLIFLTLKLCGVIAWSWWWITSPLWLPALVAIIAVFIYILSQKVK